MSGLHIIRKNHDPDVLPLQSGIHWINELSRKHWISVGNTTLNDWVEQFKSKTYVHEQLSPSINWIINHNLGEFPIVQVIDSGGNEIEVEIVHISMNQTEIRLSSIKTGLARLNT